jgi:uncharacterized protein
MGATEIIQKSYGCFFNQGRKAEEKTMVEVTHNVVGWFEIPVTDMARAIEFYEEVFQYKLELHEWGPMQMAWFPMFPTGMGSGGTLVKHPNAIPSTTGVLIYFTAFSGDVSIELARVESAGGKVVMPRTLINEDIGYMAMFLDTEGNTIALHSRT